MHVITEHEKNQLLRGDIKDKEVMRTKPPKAPLLTMQAYLSQVEQLAKLLPTAPRKIAQGEAWKL